MELWASCWRRATRWCSHRRIYSQFLDGRDSSAVTIADATRDCLYDRDSCKSSAICRRMMESLMSMASWKRTVAIEDRTTISTVCWSRRSFATIEPTSPDDRTDEYREFRVSNSDGDIASENDGNVRRSLSTRENKHVCKGYLPNCRSHLRRRLLLSFNAIGQFKNVPRRKDRVTRHLNTADTHELKAAYVLFTSRFGHVSRHLPCSAREHSSYTNGIKRNGD